MTVIVDRERSEALAAWCAEMLSATDSEFEGAKRVAERLGAHWRGEDELAEIGFWTPDLGRGESPTLELFTAMDDVDLEAAETEASFRRERVEPVPSEDGEYHWVALSGVRPGTRSELGTLYWLRCEGEPIRDPVPYSLPFGAWGPVELYDVERLDAERADRGHFRSLAEGSDAGDEPPRIGPATSMLEVHPGTATEDGTLAGLAERIGTIGGKLEAGEALTPAERAFAGYDAIQLMPVEPLTERASAPPRWEVVEGEGGAGDEDGNGVVAVHLRKPDQVNWGYDVVVSGFSAPNPAVLRSGRPDELVDLIATCHEFGVTVVFDVALGHADERGAELLPEPFVEGPGMYGLELEYRHPVVRALLLEMQRRKMDFGADGIRVDGAQDFTYWDDDREEAVHDDEFLAEMDRVVQAVAGVEYRPWMIYEDGRPWPREDWELASTYRTLIEAHPHAFQWSPVSFAHNTPALLTFWIGKWWRLEQVAERGGNWITGVANHDTVRRGTQMDTDVEFHQGNVNPYLGEELPEILDEAYDSAAATLLLHAFLPGVPMDFVHANARAPWGFVRDTDGEWNVKVVAEESRAIDWQVTPEAYLEEANFARLKRLGFESRGSLRRFLRALRAALDVTEYDPRSIATVLAAAEPPLSDREITGEFVERVADGWMADFHEFANLSNHTGGDEAWTAFSLSVREFRQERPWLRRDFGPEDRFEYARPADRRILFRGVRTSPDGAEELLFVANMEGSPEVVEPAALLGVPAEGWEPALSPPGVDVDSAGEPVTLGNAEGVAFVRER